MKKEFRKPNSRNDYENTNNTNKSLKQTTEKLKETTRYDSAAGVHGAFSHWHIGVFLRQ
jgi:hypothetical protein